MYYFYPLLNGQEIHDQLKEVNPNLETLLDMFSKENPNTEKNFSKKVEISKHSESNGDSYIQDLKTSGT